MIDSKTANGHIRHAKISADSDKSRDRVFRCLKKYQEHKQNIYDSN